MEFKQVSKDEFYATVGNMDVVTRPERDKTYWELRNRELVGITTPGYSCEGIRTYQVREGLINDKA